MKKKAIVIFIVVFVISVSFYNTANTSIDDIYIANCILVDINENGMIEMMFISPKAKESEEGSESDYETKTGLGLSIIDCFQSAERQTGKEIFIGHLKSLIIGKNIAASKEKMDELFEYFERNSTFNYFTSVFFTNNKIADFENTLHQKQDSTTGFIESIIQNTPSKRFLNKNYNEIINEGACYSIPLLTVNENIEYNGFALFKNNQYVKNYNNDDTLTYKLACETTYDNYITSPNCDIVINKSSRSLKRTKDTEFELTIYLRADVLYTNFDANFEENGGEEIKIELENQIEESVYKLFEDARAVNADIFNIEKYMERYHYKDYMNYKETGVDILNSADITVKVDTKLLRNATMY